MPLLPLRRSHSRYSIKKIVSYCYEEKRFLTFTLNLGLGGMKIKTHYNIPEGENLDLTLVLGNTSIDLKGRTVYSHVLPGKQKVSGIEFVDLSERDRNTLRNHLAALGQWPKKRGMLFANKRTATRVKISPERGDRK